MALVILSLLLSSIILFIYYFKPIKFSKRDYKIIIAIIMQASVIALGFGHFIWTFTRKNPQNYSDFISGYTTLIFENKSADYFGLFTTLITFILAYYIFSKHYSLAAKANIPNETLVQLSIISLIPYAIMIGQWLIQPETVSLLIVSLFSVFLCQIIIAILRIIVKFHPIPTLQVNRFTTQILLIILFWGFSALGFMVATNRLGFLWLNKEIVTIWAVVSALLLGYLLWRKIQFTKIVDIFLPFSQIGLPLLFLVTASPPVLLRNGEKTLFFYEPLFYILLFLLIGITLFDIINHSLWGQKTGTVSPWSLSAILVSFSMELLAWPSINPDNYHAGEFYLPWWLFEKFDYLPFIDYQPARGLINYFPGLFSRLFFDNTFSGQSMITGLLYTSVIIIGFFIIRLWVNDFLALLITISLSPWIAFNFSLTFLGAILLLGALKKFNFSYLTEFWITLLSLPIIWILQVAEGSAVILGLLPLLAYLLLKSWETERKHLVYSVIIFTFLLITSYLIFPSFINMFISAGAYVLNQGNINELAYGISWRFIPGITSGLLWQFFRFSWLLLLLPLVHYLNNYLQEMRTGRSLANKERFFLLLSMLIIIFALVPRAAGRIDAVPYSRPYIISMIIVLIGLPIVIFPALKNSETKFWGLLFIALVFGVLGSQEVQLQRIMTFPTQFLQQPVTTVQSTGLNKVGQNIIMAESQISRQQAIKNDLELFLNPQETYYNATNNNSDYGFQDRPSPVSNPAFYNIPAESQQFKAIEQLEEKNVPIVLIHSDNILPEGTPLPLRTFYVYRYLMENFVPFQGNSNYIWMVRKGEEDRLSNTGYTIGSLEEQAHLLEISFGKSDLQGIPASWGQSFDSLEKKLVLSFDLMESGYVQSSKNASFQPNGDLLINNSESTLRLKLPELANETDFIFLTTNKNDCQGIIQISWGNEFESTNQNSHFLTFTNLTDHYLIPVSTSPMWHMSKNLNELVISFYPETECNIVIDQIKLFARKY